MTSKILRHVRGLFYRYKSAYNFEFFFEGTKHFVSIALIKHLTNTVLILFFLFLYDEKLKICFRQTEMYLNEIYIWRVPALSGTFIDVIILRWKYVNTKIIDWKRERLHNWNFSVQGNKITRMELFGRILCPSVSRLCERKQ